MGLKDKENCNLLTKFKLTIEASKIIYFMDIWCLVGEHYEEIYKTKLDNFKDLNISTSKHQNKQDINEKIKALWKYK